MHVKGTADRPFTFSIPLENSMSWTAFRSVAFLDFQLNIARISHSKLVPQLGLRTISFFA